MTTRPTIAANKAVNATLGAAEWNTNCLQQGNWTQEVLLGTNADKIATPGAFPDPTDFTGKELRVGKNVPSGAPGTLTDTMSIFFNRSNADHEVDFINCHTSPSPGAKSFSFVANAYAAFLEVFGVTNDGKITGKGFYASAMTTVTNGSTVNFSHGLGAQPRFIGGRWDNVNTTLLRPINTVLKIDDSGVGGITASVITIINNTGATAFVILYAML